MFDEDGKILVVKNRKNKYSFPKGKLEQIDSSNYECARREFLEETGYSGFSYYTDKKEIPTSGKENKTVIYFLCRIDRKFSWFGKFLSDPDFDIIDSGFYTIEEIESLDLRAKELIYMNFEKTYYDEI